MLGPFRHPWDSQSVLSPGISPETNPSKPPSPSSSAAQLWDTPGVNPLSHLSGEPPALPAVGAGGFWVGICPFGDAEAVLGGRATTNHLCKGRNIFGADSKPLEQPWEQMDRAQMAAAVPMTAGPQVTAVCLRVGMLPKSLAHSFRDSAAFWFSMETQNHGTKATCGCRHLSPVPPA